MLYHFVLLHNVDNVRSTQRAGAAAEMTLYAYESVELELGLSVKEEDDEKSRDPFSCPIKLMPDPLAIGMRYLCHHKAGIHCVALPMASQLAELAMSDDGVAGQITSQAQEDSIVEYLVCTRLKAAAATDKLNCNAVIGANVAVKHLTGHLICLFNDYDLQILPLSSESCFP